MTAFSFASLVFNLVFPAILLFLSFSNTDW